MSAGLGEFKAFKISGGSVTPMKKLVLREYTLKPIDPESGLQTPISPTLAPDALRGDPVNLRRPIIKCMNP